MMGSDVTKCPEFGGHNTYLIHRPAQGPAPTACSLNSRYYKGIQGNNTNFFSRQKNANTKEPYVYPRGGQVIMMGSDVTKCPYCGADVPCSLFFDDEAECPECGKKFRKEKVDYMNI